MSPLNPDSWPPTATTVALSVSSVAFLLPLTLLLALRLLWRATRRAAVLCFGTSAVLLLALNPVAQLFTLGPLDVFLRNRWAERATAAHLVGMTPAEVQGLFGEPCHQRGEAPAVCGSAGCSPVATQYIAWDYAPLPIFWLSHAGHFKVFFSNGRATGFNRGG